MQEDQGIYFPQYKRQYHKEAKSIRRAFRQDVYFKKRGRIEQISKTAQHPQEDQTSKEQEKNVFSEKLSKIIDKARQLQIREIMQIPIEQLVFQNVLQELKSHDNISVHYGMISLRRLLIIQQKVDLVQRIIDAGLIPKFLSFCFDDSRPQLKLEAAWILANLSAGSDEQCEVLAFHKAHIQLIQVMQRNEQHIVDQVIWAIGNFAASGCQIRDSMVQNSLIYKLWEISNSTTKLSILSSITWVMSNILRCKPQLKFQEAKSALKFICKAIKQKYHGQNPQNCYYALAPLLTYHNTIAYDMYEEQGIFLQVILFVNQHYLITQFQTSMYVIGCLLARVSYYSKYLKKIMSQSVLTMCQNVCAKVKNTKILKEYLFFIANLVSERSQVSDQLILRESFFQTLVVLLKQSESTIKNQAIYVIGNASLNASPKLIYHFIQKYEIIPLFADFFINSNHHESLQCVIQNLNKLFELPRKTEFYSYASEKQNKKSKSTNCFIIQFLGIPNTSAKLQQLQFNQNPQVQKALERLIDTISKDGWLQQSSLLIYDLWRQ